MHVSKNGIDSESCSRDPRSTAKTPERHPHTRTGDSEVRTLAHPMRLGKLIIKDALSAPEWQEFKRELIPLNTEAKLEMLHDRVDHSLRCENTAINRRAIAFIAIQALFYVRMLRARGEIDG